MPPQFENNNVQPINTEKPYRDPSILIILIIVMLLSGAGAIWYMFNLPPEPEPEVQPIVKTDQFADWQTYRNEKFGFEFKYPILLKSKPIQNEYYFDKLQTGKQESVVTLFHEVSTGKKSTDTCRLEGSGLEVPCAESMSDISFSFFILTENLLKIKSAYQDISIGNINVAGKVGLATSMGAEGDGVFYYFVPLDDTKTLAIVRPYNDEFGSGKNDQEIFDQILSTFKFISASTLSVPSCDHFSNYYKEIDKNIIDKAKENAEFLRFINEGYTLQNICNSTNKNLAVFDSNDKYWKDAPNVTSEELYRIGSRLLFWITDDKFLTGTFYKLNIDDYRFEGTGGMACNFDKISGNNILFICVNAGDGGTDTTWYAYDTLSQNNFMVRSKLKMRYSDLGNKDQIYDSSLLKLFSYQ